MPAIRWTGKGLKLIGGLLDTETFEAWAEAQGRQFIEDKVKTLTLKQLAGTTRAKHAVRSNASATINSEPFKEALENQLRRLPYMLLQNAKNIRYKGPSRLHWSGFGYTVVVCPRGLVREAYVNTIVAALADAAELPSFVGLPETFLKRTAATAEEEWFSRQDTPIPLPDNRSAVLGVEANYGWNTYGMNGHYYVALADFSYKPELTNRKGKANRKAQRELKDETASLLTNSKVTLGEMSRPEIDEIVTELPSPQA